MTLSPIRVLVVDDDPGLRAVTARVVRGAGHDVDEADCGARCLEVARARRPDLIILDVNLPDADGRELVQQIKRDVQLRDCSVVLASGVHTAPDDVAQGLVGGADGFIRRPVRNHELAAWLEAHARVIHAERALRLAHREMATRVDGLEREMAAARAELARRHGGVTPPTTRTRGLDALRGSSAPMRQLRQLIQEVAPVPTTVLIQGETGTGKELVAQAIHDGSPRGGRPLIALNCAALPPSLAESELFGRERGAFTGANAREIGRFEAARDSTLFLDEIAELPAEAQAKLLRVLDEKRFQRLGSARTVATDARVIAATNRVLEEEVEAGRFRRDLYYRLNVFTISVPPLREHPDDVPGLVRHFVDELAPLLGRQIEEVPADALAALHGYRWPGNVRELRNLVERALVRSPGPVLQLAPPEGHRGTPAGETLEAVERAHVLRVLAGTGWRVRGAGGAASVLGLKPSTLESKMKRLGISRP